jgi:simple sugar transport system permease protein
MSVDFFVNWLSSTPVTAAPILIAALGLIISERAGVLNLSADGLMLAGAMASAAAYFAFDMNPWAGMAGAALAGAAVSVIFAFMVVVLRADQVVTGLAMVFFCGGLTSLIAGASDWAGKSVAGFERLRVPLLADLPVVGPILFHQDAWVYLTLLLGLAIHLVLFRTMSGLRLRAVGHDPAAADAAGTNVLAYRFWAVIVGGAIVGLSGGYLVLASAKIYVDQMTGGRGWIAIALVIFARWQPSRALLGALIFGGVEALIPRLLASGTAIPQYFLLMTPYVATLLVLVWAALYARKGSDAPQALGLPFVREDRR